MDITREVKHYYGTVLQSSKDLQTSACCTDTDIPNYLKPLMNAIHPEVAARYYGCGLVAPEALEGCSILDLGSGSGRDVFLLSALVGPQGSVTGVDMTEEQLAVANRHIDYHAEKWGHANVRFLHGQLEKLDQLPLESESFDLIVSNCVINLVEDKAAVLKQAHRLLKPGGEFYFSDVYADRRLPEAARKDPVLYGECLGGALYWNDFVNLAKQAGFGDPRLVNDRPIALNNPQHAEILGNALFFSATYRLMKIDTLEPACEDYGQAVRYLGSIKHHPHRFVLDKHHIIDTGKLFPVCGNTWRMIKESRFSKHFEFFGDFSTHFGIFSDCGTGLPFDSEAPADNGPSGCC